jgi:hypothetical protein
MNEKTKESKRTLRYYKYPNTSGRLNIPADIGDFMDWDHKEFLEVSIESIDGDVGLFIKKSNKKRR